MLSGLVIRNGPPTRPSKMDKALEELEAAVPSPPFNLDDCRFYLPPDHLLPEQIRFDTNGLPHLGGPFPTAVSDAIAGLLRANNVAIRHSFIRLQGARNAAETLLAREQQSAQLLEFFRKVLVAEAE